MNKDIALEKGKNILERIKFSEKFLIVPDASRVDYDCVGTAIALKKFLKKLGKDNVRIYLFGTMPEYLEEFNIINGEIETKYLKEVNLDFYDLIFLVDTNDWERVLTRDYAKFIVDIDKNKFINIDHHQDGSIIETNKDNVINFHDVCAGKVLFDAIINQSDVELDSSIANPLYLSLIGDTSIFKFINEDTFEFADELIKAGADHTNIADLILTNKKGAIDFFIKAVNSTKYYPQIKLTTLSITEKLHAEINQELGDTWEKDDYADFYKEYFQRRIEGFNYGIIFRYDPNSKGTRISWRIKNSGETIEIMPILNELGFKAGGHRNAGGGFAKMMPEQAEELFVEAMRKELGFSQ